MAWTSLVTNVRWGSESPAIYFDLYYDSYRSVNSMFYKTKISIRPCATTFAEEIYVKFYLDNILKLNNTNIKAYTPTTWASPIEYESSWYEVSNKLSGTTKLDYWLFSDNRLYNYIYYLPVLGAGSVLGNISNFTVDTAYGVGNNILVPCTKYDASYFDVLFVYLGDYTLASRYNFTSGNFAFTEAELTTPYTGVYARMGSNLSATFRFAVLTYTNSNYVTQIGTASEKFASGTVTNYGSSLNTISNFTFDSTEGVGNPFTVSVNKPTATSYDVLTIKIGSNTVATRDNYLTGTVTFSNAEITTATTGIYALMTAVKSTTFTFELKSYSDSSKSSQVGTTSTKTATGYINTYLPYLDSVNITHLDSNATTVALTGSYQKFIQGHSDLEITVSSKATTYRGATLGNNAYGFLVSGAITQYSNHSDSLDFVKTFNDINVGSYSINVVDSRAMGATYNKDLSFTAYSNPTISSLSITRLNGSAADIYIALSGTYTDWTGLSTTNSIQTSRFRYKEVGGAYGSYTNITLTTNTGGSYTKTSYNAVDLDVTKDYEFEVEIIDKLESVTQIVFVPAGTGSIVLDIANKSVGVGKIPDASVDRGSLDILSNLYFNAVRTFGVQIKEVGNSTISSAGLVRLISDKVEPCWGIDTETAFVEETIIDATVCEIDTNKYVVVYRKSSDNCGYARVISVSGTDISFGDEVQLDSNSGDYFAVAKLNTDKAIVLYRDVSPQFSSRVISVSGTTITLGNIYTNSVQGTYIELAQINTDKVIASYRNVDNNSYGTARVLTVSGTAITYGTAVVFESSAITYNSIAKLATDKAIVCYADTGNNSYGTACAMTVSTATITAGTPLAFNATSGLYPSVTQITTDKALVIYRSTDTYGYACTLNVATRTITAGTPVNFNSNAINIYTSVNMLDSTTALAFYKNGSNYGETCMLTTSSTSTIVPSTPIVVNAGTVYYCSSSNITTNEMLLIYRDSDDNGKVAVYKLYDGDGYALTSAFNSGLISGRVDSVDVVPYVPLS